MEANKAGLWEKYCSISHFIVAGLVQYNKVASKTIDRVLDPSNLFDFLKEHREEWEWRDCDIDGGCYSECIINHKCRQTEHKIQHPAAKYLDSLEGK